MSTPKTAHIHKLCSVKELSNIRSSTFFQLGTLLVIPHPKIELGLAENCIYQISPHKFGLAIFVWKKIGDKPDAFLNGNPISWDTSKLREELSDLSTHPAVPLHIPPGPHIVYDDYAVHRRHIGNEVFSHPWGWMAEYREVEGVVNEYAICHTRYPNPT